MAIITHSTAQSTPLIAHHNFPTPKPVESLDYEISEIEVLNKVEIYGYVALKWMLCFLIGVLSGCAGFLVNLTIENLAGVKFVITSNMMLANRYVWAVGVFAGCNFVLTMFAGVITAYVAPAAAGSGIPEVKAYLNGINAPEIFSLRTLVVKIVGCITAVSSSLHVGKAGPMLHITSCIASLLGHGASRFRWLRCFENDRDMRDLVTCGAGAGIAAAFRSPIGGVLFVLESLLSWWRSALLWRAFFTTAVVTVVLRALIGFCRSGKCGLFGKGGLIMFDVTEGSVSYHLVDLPPVIVLGIIGGIFGSLYNFLLDKVLRIYTRINGKGRPYKLLLSASISIFTSCCLFGLPWLAACRPCPAAISESCPTIGRSGNFKKFQCSPDHYNDLASLFFNTNDDTIRNLFTAGTDTAFTKSSILLFFITSYFLGIISYGLAAPSGLFVPVILTGAAYGRLVGMLFSSRPSLDHGLFAVLGSASFLGGSMRLTVSICVILLELTNNLLLLPLVMLVVLISKTVGDCFNTNIYDMLIQLKGFPFLKSHVNPCMRGIKVGDVVTGPLQMFKGVERVGDIVRMLRSTGHNGFPVIDEHDVLYGLVLRMNLVSMLKKKMGWRDDDGVDGVVLTAEEMEMFVDLHPFANTSPYTVVESMSLEKAQILFHKLGLRHLLVISNCPSRVPVVGILTRHDFMPEHVLGLHPSLVGGGWSKLLRFRKTVGLNV